MIQLRRLIQEILLEAHDSEAVELRRTLEDAIADFASAWWGASKSDLGQGQRAAAEEIHRDFMESEYLRDGLNVVAQKLGLTNDDVADMVVAMLIKNFKKKVEPRGPSWK